MRDFNISLIVCGDVVVFVDRFVMARVVCSRVLISAVVDAGVIREELNWLTV